MKLYEFPPSRSIRARWTLQELGVDFEAIEVDLRAGAHGRAEFLKINPAGKVPALVDGDLVVTESAAIALYLGEKYPQKRLVPTELRQRAEFNRWLYFTVTELEQPLWRIAKHSFIYPEAQRRPAEIDLAGREFKQMAAVIDGHMRGRQFVVGEGVTIADFVLAYTLDWGTEAKLLGDFPELISYVERMYARPNAAPRIAQARASVAAR